MSMFYSKDQETFLFLCFAFVWDMQKCHHKTWVNIRRLSNIQYQPRPQDKCSCFCISLLIPMMLLEDRKTSAHKADRLTCFECIMTSKWENRHALVGEFHDCHATEILKTIQCCFWAMEDVIVSLCDNWPPPPCSQLHHSLQCCSLLNYYQWV